MQQQAHSRNTFAAIVCNLHNVDKEFYHIALGTNMQQALCDLSLTYFKR